MRRGRSLVGGIGRRRGGEGGGRGGGGRVVSDGAVVVNVFVIFFCWASLSPARALCSLLYVSFVRWSCAFFFRSFLCFWEGKTTRSFCVVLDPSLVFHFWIAETAKWRNNVAGTSK
jgi:hypothetical protein